MRLFSILGGLLVLSACGGELQSDERAGRTRLPTESFGEERGSVGPNPASGRTYGSIGSEVDDESAPVNVGATPAPEVTAKLYAIGQDRMLYHIDLAAPSAVPIHYFWREFPWRDCDGNPVVGEARFTQNDLVVDPDGRLIVGGRLVGVNGFGRPSNYDLGLLSVVNPANAALGDDLLRLPIVPQGLTFTREGWLAVVGDGLLEVDLTGGRPVVYRVLPGRFQATGGLIELDGKLLFPIEPSGHATYDLATGELETFESSFDASYQGLVIVKGSPYALLTDGRVAPIDAFGATGTPVMFENSWYGAAALLDQ